jgi:probable phosphoglycerate mutase
MRLILIRHGRTSSNVAGLLDTAFPGADLDAVGKAQASGLVERLAGEPIDGLYASDLVRTQQTAAPLADHRGLSVPVLGGLREIQAGAEELSPVWDRYVAVLRAWARGDLGAQNPRGESAHAFFARYDAAVASVLDAGHTAAGLVSHGAAIRTWVGHRVRGLDPHQAARRSLGNTGYVVVEGDPRAGWTFVGWSDGVPTEEPSVPNA